MSDFDIQARFNALNTEVSNEPTVPGGIAHFLAGIARMAADRGDGELAEYINAHTGTLIANSFSNVKDNSAPGVEYTAQVDPDKWHKDRVKEESKTNREAEGSDVPGDQSKAVGGNERLGEKVYDPQQGKTVDGDRMRNLKPTNTKS